MENGVFQFKPIGVVHCPQKYRFETPRQGVFSGCDGEIELFSSYGGDAIADLAGFERIWVIFAFHLNIGKPWKSRVQPPFPANGRCRSLFATRSPHRVNPLGMSCVELAEVRKNRLLVKHIDMLDGSPVLDIKPYIPEADAFPFSAVGWRSEVPEAAELSWEMDFAAEFVRQAEFIRQQSGLDMMNFARVQLANEPLDAGRKRVRQIDAERYSLGCRTWKIIFRADEKLKKVEVLEIDSNYSASELSEGAEDIYNDKDIHRKFFREKINQKDFS